MNHYLGKKGYVFLMFFVYAGITAVFNIVMGILSRVGMDAPFTVILGLKVGIAFAATFILAGRFLNIEKRVPSSAETGSIAFWSFLLIALGMLLNMPLAIGMSKMNPDVETSAAVANSFLMLAVLSASIFVFCHLNFGVFAKTRSFETS